MKKLLGSLYTLYHIYNQIDLLFKAVGAISNLRKEDDIVLSETDTKMTLKTVTEPGLLHNVFTLTCSFLDEWNKEFTHIKIPEYGDRILKLKRITKPAFKRINKWPGLRDFRNIVFAHNLRVNGEDIFTTGKKHDIIFPLSNSEVTLLIVLLRTIADELMGEFSDIEIDSAKTIIENFNITSNPIDPHKEWDVVYNEIIQLKLKELYPDS